MKRTTQRRDRAARGISRALCLVSVLPVLAGCDREATPLPPEKAAYVGIWEHGRFGEGETYAYLQISEDGYIAYARNETSGTDYSCMVLGKAPVGSITDAQITVPLFWGFTVDFAVSEPPHESGGVMRMTVDGDALMRTDTRSGGFDFEWDCNDGDFSRRRVG